MDQRDHAHEIGRTGSTHSIWRFRIYGIAVRWIYAPARMDVGLLRVCGLLCGCKSVSDRVDLEVAA